MDLGLERGKRKLLAVNADVAVLLVARREPVRRHLAVADIGIGEKARAVVAHGRQYANLLEDGYVAVNRDEVEQSVVGQRRWEKVGLGRHERHL